MVITHVTHSCFLIETQNAYILFDYFGKEDIPKFSDKKIYIFSSHQHGDHFTMGIFEKFDEYNDVTYFLSYDIKRKYGKEIEDKYPKSVENITYMMPNKRVKTNDICVDTIGSTDMGVAFIVKMDGLVFFHAGDLHLWLWSEETKEGNEKMRKRYEREIAKLENIEIDYAFYPTDLRQQEYYDHGLIYLLSHVKIKKLFPMHFFGNYETSRVIKENPRLSAYSDIIVYVGHKGETFTFSEEK